MKATERQHLVERYSSGALSSEEQRLFQQRLRTDPELRRLAAAERTIGSAMASDRARQISGATAPGPRLQAMIAASHHQGMLAAGSGLFGSTTAAILVAATGLVALAVALVLSVPGSRSQDDAAPVRPTQIEVPMVPNSSAPEADLGMRRRDDEIQKGSPANPELRDRQRAASKREEDIAPKSPADREDAGRETGDREVTDGRADKEREPDRSIPEFTTDEAPVQIDVR